MPLVNSQIKPLVAFTEFNLSPKESRQLSSKFSLFYENLRNFNNIEGVIQ
jgi:hypothetical protein